MMAHRSRFTTKCLYIAFFLPFLQYKLYFQFSCTLTNAIKQLDLRKVDSILTRYSSAFANPEPPLLNNSGLRVIRRVPDQATPKNTISQ